MLLVKLNGNDTHTLIGTITQRIIQLPTQLKKSLTWDRAIELAQHKMFTIDTNIKCGFNWSSQHV